MPGPVVFPCGGPNQPACPPQNTSPTNDSLLIPEEAIIHAALHLSDEAKARLIEQLIATEGK